MKPCRLTTALLVLVLVFSLGGTVLTVRHVDNLLPAATLEEVLYLPSPKVLKRLSLGYTGLLADIYWTRAVQYFGRKHAVAPSHFDLLAPLLDITTQLDPHLTVAYEFGSIFLAQKPPEGAGMPDKAVQLVESGIRQNPNDWRLYYNLGFIHYMERKDYPAAAKAFAAGAEVPGAHPWLKVLAARMAEHGGDIETARFMWTKTYESTLDKQIKISALGHLRALAVDEQVLKLNQLLADYYQKTGHYPENWLELVRARWLPGIPLDPVGHPYKLLSGGHVEVAIPAELPFITQGLPPAKAAMQPSRESNQ
jgi:tetratricopeptide (TPR) repeat protein